MNPKKSITFNGLEKSIIYGNPDALIQYCKEVQSEMKRIQLQVERVRISEFEDVLRGIGMTIYRALEHIDKFLKVARNKQIPENDHGYREIYDYFKSFDNDFRLLKQTFKELVGDAKEFIPATRINSRETYRHGHLVSSTYQDNSRVQSLGSNHVLPPSAHGVVFRIVNRAEPVMEELVHFFSRTVHAMNNFIPKREIRRIEAAKEEAKERDRLRTDEEWDALIMAARVEAGKQEAFYSYKIKFWRSVGEKMRTDFGDIAKDLDSQINGLRDKGLLAMSRGELIHFHKNFSLTAQMFFEVLRRDWHMKVIDDPKLHKAFELFYPKSDAIYQPDAIKLNLERFGKGMRIFSGEYFMDYLSDLVDEARKEQNSKGLNALMRKLSKKSREKSKLHELEHQEKIIIDVGIGAISTNYNQFLKVADDATKAYETGLSRIRNSQHKRIRDLKARRDADRS